MNPETPVEHEQQPRRKRLDLPEPPPPGRRGCLWAGGLLGAVAGVVLALFALGPVLNYFFGEANIGLGDAYDIRGLRIELLSLEDRPHDPSPSGRAYTAVFAISVDEDRDKPFPLAGDDWHLQLEDGTRIERLDRRIDLQMELTRIRGFDLPGERGAVMPGESVELRLFFPVPEPPGAPPEHVFLDEPSARFDLVPHED